MTASPRRAFSAGVRSELPLLVGVFPFGMIYGVLAIAAGIPPLAAQAMSAIVFAGSSQFIFTQLVTAAAPALVIVLTVGVVNLRHMLYSASLAPYLSTLRPAWKWLLSYLLTDEAYAVSIIHFRQDDDPSTRHWYFLGAGLALWSCWQISTAAGILLGAVIPESWSLDFTLALTFIAMLVPSLTDRPLLAAALTAGIVAVVAYSVPMKLGLVAAALAGILVGLWLEMRK